MKILNVNKFGKPRDVNQMIKAWKKDIEKSDLIYELKKREVFYNKAEKSLMKRKHHEKQIRKFNKKKFNENKNM